MKLRNSNILIFGGSSGIGKAIAKRLISAGAIVMITGRNETKLEEAKKEISGNILNISSNAMCMDIIGGYGASKLALERWTRAFEKKYSHFEIIINGIAPSATLTTMISSYAHDISEKYERHAIERFIKSEEIAELAFYLLSDYGEIICGHTVVADGGDNAATLWEVK